MSPVVRYSLLRIGLFLIVLEILILLRVGNVFLAALLAALISGLVSFVLLRDQRDAVSVWLVTGMERRRQKAAQRAAREDSRDDAWRAAHGDPPPRGPADDGD